LFTAKSPATNVKTILPHFLLFGFILFNAIKVTLYNTFVSHAFTALFFSYKFMLTLIWVLVIYFLIFKLKKPVVFVLLYLIQLLYIVATFTYFDYFHSYLHIIQSIRLFKEGMDAVAALAFPKDPRTLLFFIDLPFAVLILLKYKSITQLNTSIRFYKKVLIICGLSLLLLTETWHYAHNFSFVQLASNSQTSENLIVERYGTLANSFLDIMVYSENERLIDNLKYGKAVQAFSSMDEKPNFVIIQIESMDANVANFKYKDQYIAPFLHSLTDKSVYFPYTLSYHKGGATSDCEFSALNSVEPLDNYPAIKLTDYNYPNSLVHKLDEGGYDTKIFHGNIASYFNRDIAFPKMGFKEFYDMKRMNLKDVGWGAPDHEVFNFAENQMKNETEPFFYHVITMTSHGPFTNANYYYNNKYYDGVADVTLRNYYNSISYVDKSIEDFVNYIRANTKNTYIFIYGDHTPNISNDLYAQASLKENEKYFEFVPLFILTPDRKVYKENKKVASFLDIAPTILFNSDMPFKYKIRGMNLLDTSAALEKIPFKGEDYDRNYLFTKISSKK
jgi:lipoteichoic acid synthase